MNLAFGSAVLLLFLSGLAAYSAVMRLLEAEQWVDHTRDVQSTLKDIGNLSARAGRARTQFVDSGDLSFLQDYERSANEVRSKMQRLELLMADNNAQQENRGKIGAGDAIPPASSGNARHGQEPLR